MDDTRLPTDPYSKALRDAHGNPSSVAKQSTIDLQDFLGNNETWTIKTIRTDGADTVFVQRINVDGGSRFVLPPAVTEAMARQRSSIVDVMNRRRATSAAATRRAKGAKR
jgi:hypothetical protein